MTMLGWESFGSRNQVPREMSGYSDLEDLRE